MRLEEYAYLGSLVAEKPNVKPISKTVSMNCGDIAHSLNLSS